MKIAKVFTATDKKKLKNFNFDFDEYVNEYGIRERGWYLQMAADLYTKYLEMEQRAQVTIEIVWTEYLEEYMVNLTVEGTNLKEYLEGAKKRNYSIPEVTSDIIKSCLRKIMTEDP